MMSIRAKSAIAEVNGGHGYIWGRNLLLSVSSVVFRCPPWFAVVVNLQHQAIIGQLHAGGQAHAGGFVRQVVADVGEVGALGSDPRDDVERLGHVEVRRMRTLAQRVEHEDADAAASVRSGHDSSGIRLQSVRYANGPTRNPSTGNSP